MRQDPLPTDPETAPSRECTPQDWQEKYLQEVEQSRKYRKRAQQAEEQLQSLQQQIPEPDQLGRFEEYRSRAEQYEKLQQDHQQLQGKLRELTGRQALTQALAGCGVGRGFAHGDRMLQQAVALLSDRLDIDTQASRPRARPVGADPEIPAQDLQQVVSDWLAREAPHFLPPLVDTGSGQAPGLGTIPQASLAQLDANPSQKAKFIAENGPSAYVQLAREPH